MQMQRGRKIHVERCTSISDLNDTAIRLSRDDCGIQSKDNVKELVNLDDVPDAHVLYMPADKTTRIRSRGMSVSG